jgi:hypothetical protein
MVMAVPLHVPCPVPLALAVARNVTSASEARTLGVEGLAQILNHSEVRYQRRTLKKIVAWANRIEGIAECAAMYNSIFVSLEDERCARLGQIGDVERKLAGLLVRTPYVVLLSIPGIGIVTAAEFAG